LELLFVVLFLLPVSRHPETATTRIVKIIKPIMAFFINLSPTVIHFLVHFLSLLLLIIF